MKRTGAVFLVVLLFSSSFVVSVAQDEKPARPPAVKGFVGMAMLTTVWLKWEQYPEDVEGFNAIDYLIYRREEDGSYDKPILVQGDATSWTDYGLARGTKYFYKISACNEDGNVSQLTNDLPAETSIKAPFFPYIGHINVIRIPTLDVLCAIYHRGMKKEEVERVRNGLQLAREFFWRNSRCRLNLNMTYLFVDGNSPESGDDMKGIEEDLRKRGCANNQFDVVFAAAPGLKSNAKGARILGNTAASMGWRSGIRYSEIDPNINYNIMWEFVSTFYRSLDTVIVRGSGQPALSKDENDSTGDFEIIAETLKQFNCYNKFKAPWDGYIEVFDIDMDGIPDRDERVPLDEMRFECSSRYRDSDNDFLDDMDEITVGILRGSNCFKRDTDEDGILDGKDPYPLVDFRPGISKVMFLPTIDGKIEDTWKVLSKGYCWTNVEGQEVTVYAGWDDNNLYFAVKSSMKSSVTIQMYAVDENVSSKKKQSILSHVGWDNEEVVSGLGTAPVKESVAAHWIGEDGSYQTEIKRSIVDEGWVPEAGKTLKISIKLMGSADGKEHISITGPYTFYDVMLKK